MSNVTSIDKNKPDPEESVEPEQTVFVVDDAAFDRIETDLTNHPLETNLSAQRLLRRPNRWKK